MDRHGISVIKYWKSKGYSIVFTNGCFDIVHVGHLALLSEARKFGDKLVIGLNSDDSVRQLKGDMRPIMNQFERKEFLELLGMIDLVLLFGTETPKNIIRVIKPDVLVKGGDYNIENVVGAEYANTTIIVPYKDGCSTTNIIDRIRRNCYG